MHKRILNYLNQQLDFDRRETVLKYLRNESSPDLDFFVLILLSCMIATFGLITDSTAVIIGAMLVAPLMSPIMGLSLASVVGEQKMFRQAVTAVVIGVFVAISLSTILSLTIRFLPFGLLETMPDEVLVRTRPTPFDLGIAIAGGAAAAYALAMPKLSAALPGVAISTALMPPLSTIGVGIAMGNADIAFGATLLFLTNLLAISFSGIVIFVWLGFRPLNRYRTWKGVPRSVIISTILVTFVAIPLIVLTLQSVREIDFSKKIQDSVNSNLSIFEGAQLLESEYTYDDEIIDLDISITMPEQPSYQKLTDFQSAIASELGKTVSLNLIVIPATNLDPLVPPTNTPTLEFTATATITSTQTTTPSQTPSPTLTFTPSSTPTITNTVTLTPTITPTMLIARINNPEGMYVRDNPGGTIIFSLPNNAYLRLPGDRVKMNNQEWIKIIDMLNRTGWVPLNWIQIEP